MAQQDFSSLVAELGQGPEVQQIRKRAKRRGAEAEARAQSEVGRRGLTGQTGTSDIEFAARRGARAPIEESAALAEAGIIGRGVEAERGRRFQTSERLGGEAFRTGEREAGQRFVTGERIGGQEFRTGEREAGQEFTSEENEAMRKWESGERLTQREWQAAQSVLDRQAQVEAANRAAKERKRDWWKGFFH